MFIHVYVTAASPVTAPSPVTAASPVTAPSPVTSASIAIHLPQSLTAGVSAEVVIHPKTGQARLSPPVLVPLPLQSRSMDGCPDTGETLKIYGEALRKDVPYKTLFLSRTDTAANVVLEMLEKYGIDKRDAANYCLVQSNLTMPDDGGEVEVAGGGTIRENILEDDVCPLNIMMDHPASRGAVTFHVRRHPPDGNRAVLNI